MDRRRLAERPSGVSRGPARAWGCGHVGLFASRTAGCPRGPGLQLPVLPSQPLSRAGPTASVWGTRPSFSPILMPMCTWLHTWMQGTPSGTWRHHTFTVDQCGMGHTLAHVDTCSHTCTHISTWGSPGRLQAHCPSEAPPLARWDLPPSGPFSCLASAVIMLLPKGTRARHLRQTAPQPPPPRSESTMSRGHPAWPQLGPPSPSPLLR